MKPYLIKVEDEPNHYQFHDGQGGGADLYGTKSEALESAKLITKNMCECSFIDKTINPHHEYTANITIKIVGDMDPMLSDRKYHVTGGLKKSEKSAVSAANKYHREHGGNIFVIHQPKSRFYDEGWYVAVRDS